MKITIEITYLIASVLFILGIKYLGSPKTARKGNLYAAIGMFLAIAATLFDQQVLTFEWIIIGSLIGSIAGVIMAYKTPMTGMPQMVGMLNGFGGGASILVALSEYFKKNPNYPVNTGLPFDLPIDQGIAIILSILIGGIYNGVQNSYDRNAANGWNVKWIWRRCINTCCSFRIFQE